MTHDVYDFLGYINWCFQKCNLLQNGIKILISSILLCFIWFRGLRIFWIENIMMETMMVQMMRRNLATRNLGATDESTADEKV